MSRAQEKAKLPPGCQRARPLYLTVIQKCFQSWNILSALQGEMTKDKIVRDDIGDGVGVGEGGVGVALFVWLG